MHATLNTLLYDGELAEAERQARELIAAGVDALIVQDMALRRMNLPVELHASTQAATRTPEQALFSGALRLCPRDSGAGLVARRDPDDPCRLRGAIWSVSSTGRSAWGTAAAVSCRVR